MNILVIEIGGGRKKYAPRLNELIDAGFEFRLASFFFLFTMFFVASSSRQNNPSLLRFNDYGDSCGMVKIRIHISQIMAVFEEC